MKIVNIIKDGFMECAPFNWGLVLFCYGCNFNCEMCKGYNYEYVTNEKNIIGNAIDLIDKNLNPTHDCVVFLGGEPLVHKDKLISALDYCKNYKGLKTKIFTNGYDSEYVDIINYLNLCDSWSVDMKAARNVEDVIGIKIKDEDYLNNIHKTLTNIIAHKLPLEVRTTITDSNRKQEKDIKNLVSSLGVQHIIQKDFRDNLNKLK